jgi:hypothetical protein
VVDDQGRGVQFSSIEGRRSSQRAGKTAFADAVASVAPSLSRSIERTKDWRKNYIRSVRHVVVAGAASAKNALTIASEGLDSVNRNLVYTSNGDDQQLREVFRSTRQHSFHTVVVDGRGERASRLEVPYRGQRLSQDALMRQLDTWERQGVMESSAVEALRLVNENPEWLDLSDRYFVLLGAASEMGPLEALCTWGANVVAVDLPRRHIWDHIIEAARAGSGRVTVPVRAETKDLDSLRANAGLDLLTEGPQAKAWLQGFDRSFTIGNYAYADGVDFARLAAAVDALVVELLEANRTTSLAYLATPTDVFAVPQEIVEAAIHRRAKSTLRRTLGTVTGSRLYAPNYSQTVNGEGGRVWGISDCLVPIQGANYALAKWIQRWRALLAREDGSLSSANVAPATHTRSVVKNRMLAAAYLGAPSFGVEIFESATSRAVMAALLVHDLRNPNATANPATQLEHPFDVFVDAAIHGGIWQLPYEPRSVLPLALLLGMIKRPNRTGGRKK